ANVGEFGGAPAVADARSAGPSFGRCFRPDVARELDLPKACWPAERFPRPDQVHLRVCPDELRRLAFVLAVPGWKAHHSLKKIALALDGWLVCWTKSPILKRVEPQPCSDTRGFTRKKVGAQQLRHGLPRQVEPGGYRSTRDRPRRIAPCWLSRWPGIPL